MSFLLITRKCGHDTRMSRSSDEFLAADMAILRRTLCDECRSDRIFKILEPVHVDAWERSRDMGLVELTGSLKQILWATSIRLDMLKRLMTTAEELMILHDLTEMFMETMLENVKASWWIENRDMCMYGLLTRPLDLS